jgi:hypothetical protein
MFVIVSFKLDVDATARLSHMENQIVGAGRAASDPKPSSKPFEPPKSKRSRTPFTRTLLLGTLSLANLLLPISRRRNLTHLDSTMVFLGKENLALILATGNTATHFRFETPLF